MLPDDPAEHASPACPREDLEDSSPLVGPPGGARRPPGGPRLAWSGEEGSTGPRCFLSSSSECMPSFGKCKITSAAGTERGGRREASFPHEAAGNELAHGLCTVGRHS